MNRRTVSRTHTKSTQKFSVVCEQGCKNHIHRVQILCGFRHRSNRLLVPCIYVPFYSLPCSWHFFLFYLFFARFLLSPATVPNSSTYFFWQDMLSSHQRLTPLVSCSVHQGRKVSKLEVTGSHSPPGNVCPLRIGLCSSTPFTYVLGRCVYVRIYQWFIIIWTFWEVMGAQKA